MLVFRETYGAQVLWRGERGSEQNCQSGGRVSPKVAGEGS